MTGWPAFAAGFVVVAIIFSYTFLGKGIPAGRRLLYGALRACAAVAVLAAVARPERKAEISFSRRPTLGVLLDASASMKLPASGGASKSRRDELESLLRRHRSELEGLSRRYELIAYRFGGGLVPIADVPLAAPPSDEAATALGDAIWKLVELRLGRMAGVLVFSDGVSNLGVPVETACDLARELGVPVHAVALGDGSAPPDARVSALEAPARASVGKPFEVRVKVSSRLVQPAKATCVLRANFKDIERRELSLPAGPHERELSFSVTASVGGTLALEAELLGPSDDVVPWNNRRLAFVEIAERRVRLLYIEGVLRRDYRVLRRALGGAPGWDVDIVRAFVRGDSQASGLAGIRLEEYDAFVLGELSDDALPEFFWEAIRSLVAERGRGLLVCAGPGRLEGRLGALLPVRITDRGPAQPAPARPPVGSRIHRALAAAGEKAWTVLPPIGDRPKALELRGGAEVLLEVSGVPLAVAGRMGTGQVVAVMSGETFVWAEGPAAKLDLYPKIVRGLVAWVAGLDSSAEPISLRLSRHKAWEGDVVSVVAVVNRARGRELGLTDRELDSLRLVARLQHIGPSGGGEPAPQKTLRMNRQGLEHECSFKAEGLGIWKLTVEPDPTDQRMSSAETLFAVEGESREFERLEADPKALERLAQTTGGRFARASDAGELLQGLMRQPEPAPIKALRRSSLWDNSLALLMCLVCLCAEWWMRRR